ncbi:MAG: hemerythrin domain-containing protein [Planctomycetes bacterium]|nr:hemerythrin domain-containing protein [Planctomycetota bacterium]
MNRIDLYTTIHKGVRRTLFETTLTVASTDFSSVRESTGACQSVREMLDFLEEHAAHEDEAILPELADCAPELLADLRAEHSKLDGLQREVLAIVERLSDASEAERIALGQRLELRLGRLVAAHLNHLCVEETEVNRMLWAHRTDEQLLAVQDRIVSSIPLARLAEWYALVIPALNLRERREMLAAMRGGMPGEVFEAVTEAARRELGEDQWTAACSSAENAAC